MIARGIAAANSPTGPITAGRLELRAGEAYAACMNRAKRRTWGRIAFLLLAGAALISSTGCARKGEILLRQPFAPPSQQNVRLVTDWAYHAVNGDRQTCLLAFSLPGALRGPRAYVIYLNAPDQAGQVTVTRDEPDAARGFLVQEIGALAGRTDFVEGTVRCRNVWPARGWRQLDLDIGCEDGTQISGRAMVQSVPTEVQAFERQYAADISRLSPESQPAEGQPAEGQPTGARGSSAP